MATLTKAQKQKVLEGYNRYVNDFNNGISTARCPFRGGSWGSLGHTYARSVTVARQINEENVVANPPKLATIDNISTIFELFYGCSGGPAEQQAAALKIHNEIL